jgi:hypothetical protein
MRVAFGYATTHSSAFPLKRPSLKQRNRIQTSSLQFSLVLQTFLRAKERGADQAAKLQIERNRFDDFSKRNRITAWVTANQLDTNPFKYEGKTVGMIVQLQRMVTRDT